MKFFVPPTSGKEQKLIGEEHTTYSAIFWSGCIQTNFAVHQKLEAITKLEHQHTFGHPVNTTFDPAIGD